ncbi:hypothetical protein SFRURICE_014582, partial [Spodoptera frugiperda]
KRELNCFKSTLAPQQKFLQPENTKLRLLYYLQRKINPINPYAGLYDMEKVLRDDFVRDMVKTKVDLDSVLILARRRASIV